tara:strand:- start:705 stop:1643 length:939 start_codon:yes stop_codon:yes gene_type:complete
MESSMEKQQLETAVQKALKNLADPPSAEDQQLCLSLMQKAEEAAGSWVSTATHYSEPGYDAESTILFANWNSEGKWNQETREYEKTSNLMPLLCELAEKVGFTIEWSDEWATCEDCQGAFRVSGDSYSWTMYGYVTDSGDAICGNCVVEDPDDYFAAISGDHRKAITIRGVDPTQHGYARIAGTDGLAIVFEHGMYGGQDASPEAIGNALKGAGIEDFLFSIDSTGQFDIRFSVFVPDDVVEDARQVLKEGNTRCEVDPAVALERGLKAAGEVMNAAPDDAGGVEVVSVDLSEGTASSTVVSPEDFIKGVRS